MNKQEFLANRKGNLHYKTLIDKELRQWKSSHNITETCDVHHRDDTEECRKYNEEHYELWGFEIDENGNEYFEYGKYVVFMTHSEHSSYHNTGSRHPQFGKQLTLETKARISAKVKGEKNPFYGKHHSRESNTKNSETNKQNFKRYVAAYHAYKERGGELMWQRFLTALSKRDLHIEDFLELNIQ